MKVLRGVLAYPCPKHKKLVSHKITCRTCWYKGYESLTEFAIECNYNKKEVKINGIK